MDGIADVGSVVGRVAVHAFVRKESVLVERCGGRRLSSTADRYWLTPPPLVPRSCPIGPAGNDHEH
jgi:hypothetical protein